MGIKVSNAMNNMITINGGWSPWSTVATPCVREINGVNVNVSCGGGVMIRRRSCTNPEPQVSILICCRDLKSINSNRKIYWSLCLTFINRNGNVLL